MLSIYKKVEKSSDNPSGIVQINSISELNKPFLLCLSAQDNHDNSIYGTIREGIIASRVYTSKDKGARFKIDEMPLDFLGLRYVSEDGKKKNYEEIVDKFLYPFLIGNGTRAIEEIKKQARKINFMTYCDGTYTYCKIEERIIQKLISNGFSEKDVDDIVSQISLTALGTMVDTSSLKANTIAFIDANDSEISNDVTETYKKEMQKRSVKSIYGTYPNTNNVIYVYNGSGKHDLNEYFKEGSMVKPVISGVLTSYLENSVNNTQSQTLISLSQSEKIARINKYSDQRISPSALLEELDSSLSYGKTPKYTIEEATLRQELDNCYRKIRKLQEETVRVAKYNTILEEKNKQIISGIKTNCSDTTFYKILVPSGMWQLPIGVDISNQKSDREIIEEFGENAKTNKTTLKLK